MTTETPPKLALSHTLSVSLAAMKNRPLFCIVCKATPKYLESCRAIVKGHSDLQNKMEATLLVESAWHIPYTTGEFLTRSAAYKNAQQMNESGDYIAAVHGYSAAECQAVYNR